MKCKTKDSSGDRCNETVRMIRAIPEKSNRVKMPKNGYIYLFDIVPADDGLCHYCYRKKQGLFSN